MYSMVTVVNNILYHICGEGNGNHQYSCPENPVDRGASGAAVHGVAQSRTRLKRLSSSSMPYLKVAKSKS